MSECPRPRSCLTNRKIVHDKKNNIAYSFLFFLASQRNIISQDSLKGSSCSQIASELGYFWKQDSLGTNGFRFFTYNKFIGCKIEPINPQELIRLLGKPNTIQTMKRDDRIYYIYHVLDASKVSKEFDFPYACVYIRFSFSFTANQLVLITEGDIDL